MTRLKNRRE